MKSSSVFLNSLLHFYSASIFFSGTSLLFSLLTSSKPFILSFFGTSISGDGSMLESRIITAQSDDNFIERMRFENEIISDIDSARMKFESIQFIQCQFNKCDFSKASFYDSVFDNCNFANCIFTGSYWKGSKILTCKGDGSNFSKSHMKETSLVDSSFRYANFSSSVLENCALHGCNFMEALLSEIRLKKPTLKEVNFTGADFFKTSLKDIDLSDCIIDGMIVSDICNELRGAIVNAWQATELAARFLGIKIV